MDIAHQMLDSAQASENAAEQTTTQMVNHAGKFLNLIGMEISKTSKGLYNSGEPIKAYFVGIVANKSLDVTLDYSIGKTPDLIEDF